MTTRPRHGEDSKGFSDWLRTSHQDRISSRRFSAQNLDFIWHNYVDNWLILIEEKTHGGMRNQRAKQAQQDTHNVVAQLLALSSGLSVVTMRGRRSAVFKGYYEIVFSGTSPDDSEWITINGEPATEETIVHLLTTGDIQHES